MKTFTNQQYSEAINIAPEEIKRVLNSTIIYDCIEKVVKEHIKDFDCSLLVLPIGDHLLKLLNLEEVLEEMKVQKIPDQYNLLNSIKECIEATKNSSDSEIYEIENVLKSIDKDNHPDEEPVHQSTQDALLQQTPMATPNSPRESTQPRWETQ